MKQWVSLLCLGNLLVLSFAGQNGVLGVEDKVEEDLDYSDEGSMEEADSMEEVDEHESFLNPNATRAVDSPGRRAISKSRGKQQIWKMIRRDVKDVKNMLPTLVGNISWIDLDVKDMNKNYYTLIGDVRIIKAEVSTIKTLAYTLWKNVSDTVSNNPQMRLALWWMLNNVTEVEDEVEQTSKSMSDINEAYPKVVKKLLDASDGISRYHSKLRSSEFDDIRHRLRTNYHNTTSAMEMSMMLMQKFLLHYNIIAQNVVFLVNGSKNIMADLTRIINITSGTQTITIAIRDMLNGMNSYLAAYNERLSSLSSDVTTLSKLVTGCDQCLSSTNKEISQMKELIIGLNRTMCSSNQGNPTNDIFIAEFENHLSSLNGDIASINRMTTMIDQQLTLINGGITAVNEWLNKFYEAHDSLDTRLTAIEKHLDRFDQRLSAVNGSVTTIQTNINSFEQSLIDVRGHAISINQQVTAMSTSTDSIDQTVNAIGHIVSNIDEKLIFVVSNITVVHSNVDQMNSKILNVSARVDILTVGVNMIQGQCRNIDFLISAVYATHDNVRQVGQYLSHMGEEMKQAMGIIKDDLDVVKDKLREIRNVMSIPSASPRPTDRVTEKPFVNFTTPSSWWLVTLPPNPGSTNGQPPWPPTRPTTWHPPTAMTGWPSTMIPTPLMPSTMTPPPWMPTGTISSVDGHFDGGGDILPSMMTMPQWLPHTQWWGTFSSPYHTPPTTAKPWQDTPMHTYTPPSVMPVWWPTPGADSRPPGEDFRPSEGNPRPPGGDFRPPGGNPMPPGEYPRPPGGYPRPPGGFPRPPGGYPRPPEGPAPDNDREYPTMQQVGCSTVHCNCNCGIASEDKRLLKSRNMTAFEKLCPCEYILRDYVSTLFDNYERKVKAAFGKQKKMIRAMQAQLQENFKEQIYAIGYAVSHYGTAILHVLKKGGKILRKGRINGMDQPLNPQNQLLDKFLSPPSSQFNNWDNLGISVMPQSGTRATDDSVRTSKSKIKRRSIDRFEKEQDEMLPTDITTTKYAIPKKIEMSVAELRMLPDDTYRKSLKSMGESYNNEKKQDKKRKKKKNKNDCVTTDHQSVKRVPSFRKNNMGYPEASVDYGDYNDLVRDVEDYDLGILSDGLIEAPESEVSVPEDNLGMIRAPLNPFAYQNMLQNQWIQALQSGSVYRPVGKRKLNSRNKLRPRPMFSVMPRFPFLTPAFGLPPHISPLPFQFRIPPILQMPQIPPIPPIPPIPQIPPIPPIHPIPPMPPIAPIPQMPPMPPIPAIPPLPDFLASVPLPINSLPYSFSYNDGKGNSWNVNVNRRSSRFGPLSLKKDVSKSLDRKNTAKGEKMKKTGNKHANKDSQETEEERAHGYQESKEGNDTNESMRRR